MEDHGLVFFRPRCACHVGATIVSEVEDYDMVEEQSAWTMRVGPMNISRWNKTWGFHNRGVGWDTLMARRVCGSCMDVCVSSITCYQHNVCLTPMSTASSTYNLCIL